MRFFDIFKRKKENQKSEATVLLAQAQNNTIRDLWDNGTEQQWKEALNAYYLMLRPEQRELEAYIENINAEEIKAMDGEAFYDFLYNKYFVWKYTAKNRLVTTRKSLEKYARDDDFAALKRIQEKIFSAEKENIGESVEAACKIRGLGIAGATGLLAVLFPKYFGTVDQFVAKRLQEIDHPLFANAIKKMKPDGLKYKDGLILIHVLREKAAELNKRFHTDFWTPRKIDMILWAYGR